MNLFDRINDFIENSEGSLITLITSLIPWLSPALPAYLTWLHLTSVIGIPSAVAGAMSATVEFLGLSAVSTAFQAMRHNKLNRAEKNRMALAFPIGAYLYYLLVVVVVNVLLSVTQDTWAIVLANGLLTTISAPAFIIAVSRQQQRQIQAEIANGKKSVDTGKMAKSGKNDKPTAELTEAERYAIENNVSLRTAYRRRAKNKNGHKETKEMIEK